MEELGVSETVPVTCAYAGSSVMPLGAALGSDTGVSSLRPGSRESYFQVSLGGVMFED